MSEKSSHTIKPLSGDLATKLVRACAERLEKKRLDKPAGAVAGGAALSARPAIDDYAGASGPVRDDLDEDLWGAEVNSAFASPTRDQTGGDGAWGVSASDEAPTSPGEDVGWQATSLRAASNLADIDKGGETPQKPLSTLLSIEALMKALLLLNGVDPDPDDPTEPLEMSTEDYKRLSYTVAARESVAEALSHLHGKTWSSSDRLPVRQDPVYVKPTVESISTSEPEKSDQHSPSKITVKAQEKHQHTSEVPDHEHNSLASSTAPPIPERPFTYYEEIPTENGINAMIWHLNRDIAQLNQTRSPHLALHVTDTIAAIEDAKRRFEASKPMTGTDMPWIPPNANQNHGAPYYNHSAPHQHQGYWPSHHPAAPQTQTPMLYQYQYQGQGLGQPIMAFDPITGVAKSSLHTHGFASRSRVSKLSVSTNQAPEGDETKKKVQEKTTAAAADAEEGEVSGPGLCWSKSKISEVERWVEESTESLL